MAYLFSILAGLYFQIKAPDLLPYLILAFISGAFFLTLEDREGKKKLALCLGLFVLFYARAGLQRDLPPRAFQGPVKVKVLDCLKKEESYQLRLKFLKTGERALVYSKKPLPRGGTWLVRGDFKEAEEASDLSGPFYGDYLKSLGISYTGFAQGIRPLQEPGFLDRLQNKLLHKLEEGGDLTRASRDLFNQVVLSRKTGSFWAEDLKELGLSHVLAISGLHIGLLYQGLLSLFSLGISKNKSRWLAFSMACLYLVFIGGSVSGFRVVCFLFFSILGKQKGLRFHFDHVFLFLFGLQLFLFPRYFYSKGFYLSFGAYFALHHLTPYMERIFYPFDNALTRMAAAGLAVFIGILPISLSINYEVNLAQILSNIFLLPLYTGFICLSFIYALVLILGPSLSLLAYLLNCLAGILLLANRLMARYLPLRLVFGKPSPEGYFLFYFALYLLIYGRELKRNPLCRKAIFAFSISLLATALLIPGKDRGLYFIYVGQGDASLIRGQKTRTLIDTGGSRTYRPGARYTLPFLKARGIGRLDRVVISHWDEDHGDGLKDLVGRVEIGKVYAGYFPKDQRKMLEEAGIPYRLLKEGDRLYLEEGACLDVLFSDPLAEKENNKSLVLLYREGGRKVLFPGDMEKEVEDRLNLSPLDVYHVAHHGSKTSSSPEFLDQIRPSLALVSAGKDNSYGHPHPVTIKNLEERGSKVYSLKDQGSLKLNPEKLEIKPTKEKEPLEGPAFIAYCFIYFVYLKVLEGGCALELSGNRRGNGQKGLGPPLW